MDRINIGVDQMMAKLSDWSALASPYYFSNGSVSMLATGQKAVLHDVIPLGTLSTVILDLLSKQKKQNTDNPIAFGVIPFQENEPVHFVVPEQTRVSSNIRPSSVPTINRTGGICSVESFPSEQHYKRAVKDAITQMQTGDMEKVVLARALEVQFEQAWSPDQLLLPLIKQNPYAFNFCVPTNEDKSESWLVGSSPELLVRRNGRSVLANPLAGSRKRTTCDETNNLLHQSLLESEKDLNEHAVVVNAMEQILQPYCDNLHVPLLPSVITTPAMLHLSTIIEGTLNNPATSALELATALHPTPAICGQSKADAQKFIQLSEPFQRKYFTGLVGWCDSRGNGEWAIVIRCADVTPNSLTAYAGAGIVPGSIPDDEFLETGNKMRTILAAANIPPEYALNLKTNLPGTLEKVS